MKRKGNGEEKRNEMKKYLLLIEDERVWKRFKESITKDINSEIMDLIKKKIGFREEKSEN